LAVSCAILGVASGATSFLVFILQLLTSIVFTSFLAALGVYYSATSSTVLRAQTKMSLTIFTMMIVGLVENWYVGKTGWMIFFNGFINPLTISESNYENPLRTPFDVHTYVIAGIYTTSMLTVAACFLWRWACRSVCDATICHREAI